MARLFNSSAGLTLRTLFLTTEEWNRLECLPSALLCSRENASEWLVLFSMDQLREQCRVTRWSILKECITPRPQGVIWEVPWKEANLKITGSYHVKIPTGALIETLQACSAITRWVSCNTFNTQDHAEAGFAKSWH